MRYVLEPKQDIVTETKRAKGQFEQSLQVINSCMHACPSIERRREQLPLKLLDGPHQPRGRGWPIAIGGHDQSPPICLPFASIFLPRLVVVE